jgi:hypothetical protein
MSSAVNPVPTPPHFDPELGEALGFNAEDLAANAAGTLSPAQLQRLRANTRSALIIRGVMAAIFAVLGVIFGISINDALNIIMAAIVVGSLVWMMWQGWQAARADLEGGTVAVVEGSLNPNVRRGLSSMFKMVTETEIGGERLHAVPAAQRVLQAHGRVRVYYTPHAHEIVAAEPLTAPVAEIAAEAEAIDAAEPVDAVEEESADTTQAG